MTECHPFGAKNGVVALGERHDELVGVGIFGGGDDVIVAGIEFAVADVFFDTVRKQKGFLQYHAHLMAQWRELVFADVDPVNRDTPLGDIIQAGNK